MKKINFLLIFILLAILGCNPTPSQITTYSITSSPTTLRQTQITSTETVYVSPTKIITPTLELSTPTNISSIQNATLKPTNLLPQSGSIVFAGSSHNLRKGIFLINLPDLMVTELTNESSRGYFNYHPSWSPDGEWITYSSDKEALWDVSDLYLIRSNGKDWRRLTFGGYSHDPDWSPDGKWIAYVMKDQIALIQPDGNSNSILTYTIGHKYSPTWSPDGNFIAYLFFPGEGISDDAEIWVVEIKTQSTYRVTTGANAWDTFLSWSPDGQRIIFPANLERDCKKLYSVENRKNGQVNEIPSLLGKQEGTAWSSDEQWVISVISLNSTCSQYSIDSGGKILRLFISRPDGTNVIELADLPDLEPIQPEWFSRQKK